MSEGGNANGGDGFVESAQESLKQEVGPLPVWAWILAIVIAIGVGLAIRNRFMARSGGGQNRDEGGTTLQETMGDIGVIRRTPIPTPDSTIIDMDPGSEFPQDEPSQEVSPPEPEPEPTPLPSIGDFLSNRKVVRDNMGNTWVVSFTSLSRWRIPSTDALRIAIDRYGEPLTLKSELPATIRQAQDACWKRHDFGTTDLISLDYRCGWNDKGTWSP